MNSTKSSAPASSNSAPFGKAIQNFYTGRSLLSSQFPPPLFAAAAVSPLAALACARLPLGAAAHAVLLDQQELLHRAYGHKDDEQERAFHQAAPTRSTQENNATTAGPF